MEESKKSINVECGLLFCGGWNFSKSVIVGSTFIREMRVTIMDFLLSLFQPIRLYIHFLPGWSGLSG